ncbi:MAG: class D beta-lactamase [Magnetococcales bacterium]|nr:class D beta-lactamase [Magnetococcales bacterium]
MFHKAGVTGSFALVDGDRNRVVLSDERASRERLPPASTFKVLNALIALETGVVQEESEIFPWNHQPLLLETWQRDLTLKEAMLVSSVPVFQQVARRIGLERMRHYIGQTGYGNGAVGDVVDRFWLDGPLAISALEQAQFMARLAHEQLPFSQQSQQRLRRIMPMEEIGTAQVYWKTGWAMNHQPMIGWYVGWVDNRDQKVAFALNMAMTSMEQAPLRRSLAITALHHLGVITTP